MSFISYREIDKLGRVVIPKGMRDELDIEEKSMLKIALNGDCISISKAEDSCVFCRSTEKLTKFGNKYVCQSCMEKLRQ